MTHPLPSAPTVVRFGADIPVWGGRLRAPADERSRPNRTTQMVLDQGVRSIVKMPEPFHVMAKVPLFVE